MKRLILSVIVISILYPILYAQSTPDFEWEYFGKLGQVNAFSIQDTLIWVGTDRALVEYHPSSDKQQYFFRNNSPLPVSTITSLYIDPEGDLWMGSFEHIYIKSDDQWIIFDQNNSLLKSFDKIICINEDSTGHMWFGKTWGGVLRWDGQNWEQFDNLNSPFLESVIKIVTQPDSTVWFLAYGGRRFFSFKDSVFNTFVTDSLGMSTVMNMALDPSGTLWLTGDSIYTYNSDLHIFETTNLTQFNNTNYTCSSITFDDNGNAWYWLQGAGLAFYDGNQKILYGYYHNDLQYQVPSDLTLDKNGDIWFSVSNELFHFSQDTITRITFFKDIPGENFLRMEENPDGSYWIMSHQNIFSYDGVKFSSINLDTLYNYFNTSGLYLQDLEIDSKGDKWLIYQNTIIKTDGTEWEFINLDSLNLTNYTIDDLEIDSNDIVWAGFIDLVSFDGQRWKRHFIDQSANWTTRSQFLKADPFGNLWILNNQDLYKYRDTLQYIFSYGYALDMAADRQGRIWLAPEDDGVDMFDGTNWHKYYPCSEVVTVGASFDSTAWVGCYEGDIFHFKDGEWIAYYMEGETGIWDIPSPQFIFADSKKNIWILYDNFGMIRLKEMPSLSLGEDDLRVPSELTLMQNYPNPFNSQTWFRFYLPVSSRVELVLYDVLGRKIQTIYSGDFKSGYHKIHYDFNHLSSGVYFYRLSTGKESRIGKMVLMK